MKKQKNVIVYPDGGEIPKVVKVTPITIYRKFGAEFFLHECINGLRISENRTGCFINYLETHLLNNSYARGWRVRDIFNNVELTLRRKHPAKSLEEAMEFSIIDCMVRIQSKHDWLSFPLND